MCIEKQFQNEDQECPFTFEELLFAKPIEYYGYSQQHPVILWEVNAASVQRSQLAQQRLNWARQFGMSFADNKETYKLLINNKHYYITFWDGNIRIGTELRARR